MIVAGLATGSAIAQSAGGDDPPEATPLATGASTQPATDDILSDDEIDAAAKARAEKLQAGASLGLKPAIIDALPRSVVRPVPPTQSAKLPVTGPIPAVIDREADARGEYDALGLRLGSFTATATSTTTVGGTRSTKDGDSEIYLSTIGEADLRSDWERNSVEFLLRGGLKKSVSGSDELAPEADVALSGAFDVTDVDRLSGGLGWTLRKDDDYTGKTIDTYSATLGYARSAGLIGLKTSFGVDRTQYEVSRDRENTALSGSLRLSLDSGAVFQPFVEGGVFGRAYDQRAASDGLSRSGAGGEVLIGTGVGLGSLRGEIAGGYAYEAITARGLDDIDGFILRGSADWMPTDLLAVKGTLSTTFEPTDTAGSPGTTVRSADVTVTYALAPNAYVLGGGGISYKDYVGISQNELTATLRTGVGYRINRSVEAGLGLTQKIVDSSVKGGDYNETTVEATLTLRR